MRLLLLLLLLVHGVPALVGGGRQLWLMRRVALRGLVEVGAQAVGARGARGIGLLRVLGSGHALEDLLGTILTVEAVCQCGTPECAAEELAGAASTQEVPA